MIKLVRVDDRLIHGQVQTSWIKEYQINRIIIVDDKVANDEVTKMVLKVAKPSQCDLVVCTCDRAMQLLPKDAVQINARTLVIFKTIETADIMLNKGMEIKSMVVGPTANKEGTVQMAKNTYFTDVEIAAAKDLNNKGVEVYFQLLPSEPKVYLSLILEKM